jgi:flavodoxin
MKILNLYFSSTGNTDKVAKRIDLTLKNLGHEVETVKVAGELDLDILAYDLVFAGSGVYYWLPGKPMMDLCKKLLQKYVQAGEIKPAAPRRPGKKAVIYCTYGGGHTGVNEAVPAVKYLGQLFDHLGFEIIAEWYLVGEFIGANIQHLSTAGRLGDIRGRPHEADLAEVAGRVVGILRV